MAAEAHADARRHADDIAAQVAAAARLDEIERQVAENEALEAARAEREPEAAEARARGRFARGRGGAAERRRRRRTRLMRVRTKHAKKRKERNDLSSRGRLGRLDTRRGAEPGQDTACTKRFLRI